MKFALLGYGKMGRQVEELVLQRGHEVVAIVDNEQDWSDRFDFFLRADVAIDFSMPEVAVQNMTRCFEHHIPVVVGTTGWTDRLQEMRDLCAQYGSSLVYGSNFSVGANLFMRLNRMLAQWMNVENQYAADLDETHHLAKKDAPSGTAVTLANSILEEVERYRSWQLVTGEHPADNVLPVTAHREGNVPGIHQVAWRSEEDDIIITHSAHSRRGFALGAVKAALWLPQNPGIYDFRDIAMTI